MAKTDFAIANVQCQYDSPSDCEDVAATRDVQAAAIGDHTSTRDARAAAIGDHTSTRDARAAAIGDHTYDRADEPPAFIIQQVHVPVVSNKQSVLTQTTPYVEVTPQYMTLGPGYLPSVNVIHLGDARQSHPEPAPQPPEYGMNKRIRRSELVLKEAADCVSRGLTFQTVSERFNIPISTIRFFMARKGILPRRRRGRHGHLVRPSRSPEPPFHMQHFKLPDMLALKVDADDDDSTTT